MKPLEVHAVGEGSRIFKRGGRADARINERVWNYHSGVGTRAHRAERQKGSEGKRKWGKFKKGLSWVAADSPLGP